ncbi:MAG: hypothetical protein JOS17DRAFT_150957 [Linnemannia elongata]|nr:MAG: hypothetical protein JOS17DRAFT_150957 [Linnemannia elongata]
MAARKRCVTKPMLFASNLVTGTTSVALQFSMLVNNLGCLLMPGTKSIAADTSKFEAGGGGEGGGGGGGGKTVVERKEMKMLSNKKKKVQTQKNKGTDTKKQTNDVYRLVLFTSLIFSSLACVLIMHRSRTFEMSILVSVLHLFCNYGSDALSAHDDSSPISSAKPLAWAAYNTSFSAPKISLLVLVDVLGHGNHSGSRPNLFR